MPPPDDMQGTQQGDPLVNSGAFPQTAQAAPRDPYEDIYKAVRANQYGPTYKTFSPGFLFSCEYLFYKHDPRPLVMMTRIYLDQRVAGINLHYLTFNYMRHLIQTFCGKSTFSYQAIKTDRFIVNAFRTYKRHGLRLVKGIDCKFLIAMLGHLRSYNPEDIEAMRKEVQKQLRERFNPKATEMSRRYSEMVPPGQEDFGLVRPTRSPFETPDIASVPGQGTVPGKPASIPGR